MQPSSQTSQTSSVAWWIGLAGGVIPLLVALWFLFQYFSLPFFLFPPPAVYAFGGVLIIAVLCLCFRQLRAAGKAGLITLFLSLMGWYLIMGVYYTYFTCPG